MEELFISFHSASCMFVYTEFSVSCFNISPGPHPRIDDISSGYHVLSGLRTWLMSCRLHRDRLMHASCNSSRSTLFAIQIVLTASNMGSFVTIGLASRCSIIADRPFFNLGWSLLANSYGGSSTWAVASGTVWLRERTSVHPTRLTALVSELKNMTLKIVTSG
jgi:hypothetical protein